MGSTIKKLAKSALQGIESCANWLLEKTVDRRMTRENFAVSLGRYAANASPANSDSVFARHLLDSSVSLVAHLSLGKIPGNAGDILISHLQKVLWELQIGSAIQWYDAYPDIASGRNLEFLNQTSCMVVGPGGLISGAPHKNRSGWFLDLDEKVFESASSVVVFGAGVNRWKSKRPFTDQGLRNIEKFLDRCCWIGLRETAGIRFLQENLGQSVGEKLVFQPCPSLMLGELTRELPNPETSFVSVNIAADQLVELPIDEQGVASIFQSLINHLESRDLIPILWCASRADLEFAKKYFPSYSHLLLTGFAGGQIPHIIRMFRFAVGTRMHSVFPFIGMGIPAMATFGFPIRSSVMDVDLGLKDWLCDWSEEDRDWSMAGSELVDKVDCIIDQIDSERDRASRVADQMANITRQNFQAIEPLIEMKLGK